MPSLFLRCTDLVVVGSELVEISVTGRLSCHTATVRFPCWYVLLVPLLSNPFLTNGFNLVGKLLRLLLRVAQLYSPVLIRSSAGPH